MKIFLKILKYLGLGLIFVLAFAGGFVTYHWKTLSAFRDLPSSYEAKELCSCLYVEGRPREACELFIRQTVVPIQGRDFDDAAKAVTVRALWTSSTARYTSPRYGCQLDRE
jgi:hypothetical protein